MTQQETLRRLFDAVLLLHRREASGKYYPHHLGYNNIINWSGDKLDAPDAPYHDSWKMRNQPWQRQN